MSSQKPMSLGSTPLLRAVLLPPAATIVLAVDRTVELVLAPL
jgi:hypothetical protein